MAKLLICNDLHNPMRIYVPLLENTHGSDVGIGPRSRPSIERDMVEWTTTSHSIPRACV